MTNILFVCIHNSGRSQMAEAMLNHISKEHGFNVHAESAGTVGGANLNPIAVQAMEGIGISMKGQFPKLLNPEMVERADRIVTMGCEVDADACPAKFLATEDWGLDDPKGLAIEEVRAIRNLIELHVRKLLHNLAPEEPIS